VDGEGAPIHGGLELMNELALALAVPMGAFFALSFIYCAWFAVQIIREELIK